jgi:hypothetical protein
VVAKGNAQIIDDEKMDALNAPMQKYQKQGKYESLDPTCGPSNK